MKPFLFMMFDVESVGLHGEGFAVGAVVVDANKKELDRCLYACDQRSASSGTAEDRQWVAENVPHLKLTHTTTIGVRNAFWGFWMMWKDKGAVLIADCAWPVEARFLITCVDDHVDARNWEGPYPLLDLACFLIENGADPLAKFPRLYTELPEHNPLNDARQSARILTELWK